MAGSNERAFIIIEAPNGDVREVPITHIPLVIGRDESADVRVDDKKVSRRHASFKLVHGEVWVEDLGSVNGVKLNGERVERRAVVGPNDRVKVGGYWVTRRESVERSSASFFGQDMVDEVTGPGVSAQELRDRVSRASIVVEAALGERKVQSIAIGLPLLIGVDMPVAGQTFALRRGESIIGRLEDCDVAILDGSVSRQHTRVVYTGDRVTVVDLNSSNGTFINEVRVESGDLANGDVLRVGSVGFRAELPLSVTRQAGKLELSVHAKARGRRSGGSGRLVVAGMGVLALAAVIVSAAAYWATRRNDPPQARLPTPGVVADGRGDEPGRTEGTSGAPDGDPSPARDTDPEPSASALPATGPSGAGRDAVPSKRKPRSGESPEVTARAPTADPPPRSPGTDRAPSGPPAAPAAPSGPSGSGDEPATPVAEAAPAAPETAALIAGPIPTATAPYSRVGENGLPRGLPKVDDTFDFDGFVTEKLGGATQLFEQRKYGQVRDIIATLLARDPINRDARTLLETVDREEDASNAMERGDGLQSRGALREAIEAYAEVDAQSSLGQAAAAKILALKPQALKRELAQAARLAKSDRTLPAAHETLTKVLEIDPASKDARDLIWDVERRMRQKRVRFAAYVPPGAGREAPKAGERVAAIADHLGDKSLVAVAQLYEEGDVNKAQDRADAAARRGSRASRAQAKKMAASIRALRGKYERVRAALGNDPAEAWAHLIEMQRMEREILPASVKSYLVRELEASIADGFAQRGAALFEQQRYEDAFSKWDAGYKLSRTNPKIAAGLKQLENRAIKFAEDAELAAQRGESGVCERWKRITRMTPATVEIHKRARARVRQTCR